MEWRDSRWAAALLFQAYREPGPILMCWRASTPEVEDRDVGSAGNNNIHAQIEMTRRPARQVRAKIMCFPSGRSGTDAVGQWRNVQCCASLHAPTVVGCKSGYRA